MTLIVQYDLLWGSSNAMMKQGLAFCENVNKNLLMLLGEGGMEFPSWESVLTCSSNNSKLSMS